MPFKRKRKSYFGAPFDGNDTEEEEDRVAGEREMFDVDTTVPEENREDYEDYDNDDDDEDDVFETSEHREEVETYTNDQCGMYGSVDINDMSDDRGEGSESEIEVLSEDGQGSYESDDENEWMEENQDERVNEEDLDYRLLALVNFYCKEGISGKCMRRMLSLMAVVYGEKAPFTFKEVMKVVNGVGQNVIQSVTFYCNRCARQKRFKEEKCIECNENRSEVLNRITLVKCDVKWQIEQQLQLNASEIVDAHFKIHNGIDKFSEEDIRKYPGYRSKMETKQEFERRNINLIFTLFSDGAAFKSISRREVTPVLMRLEGTDLESKLGGKKFGLVSMVFADGGVKKLFAEKFVQKSFGDMPVDVKMSIRGTMWNFKLTILTFMADMKERKLLTGLPNWNQEIGCCECVTEGQMKRSGTASYNNYNHFSLRTDDSIKKDAFEGTNGFKEKKVPKIFEYFPPKSFCLDPFHIRECGISKHLVAEILKPTNWTNLKLKYGVLGAIVECIDRIVPYTYDTVPLVSIRKSSKSTGREMDKKAVILCGLVSHQKFCTSHEYNALFIGLFYSFMCQGNLLCDFDELKTLKTAVYKLHSLVEPDSITIKYHSFYNHISSHEVQYGKMHTSEVFEREHKNLMKSVNYQSTNCEQSIIVRYICGQTCESTLVEKSRDLTCKEDIVLSLKQLKERLPTVSNETNIIDRALVVQHHAEIVDHLNLGENVLYLRRCKVSSSFGNFVFSAPSYCAARTTSSSLVCYEDPMTTSLTYGRIEFIIQKGAVTHLIVSEFVIEPFTVLMESVQKDGISRAALEVFRKCSKLPQFFGKVTNQIQAIVPLQNILCPAIELTINSSNFVMMSK